MKYAHTNLVAHDAEKLATFYVEVFECKRMGEPSKLSGQWIDDGTKVANAEIKAINLLLPGYTEKDPYLEIFQYTEIADSNSEKVANRHGLGHLAFQVDDVATVMHKAVSFGGSLYGVLINKEFKSGTLTYVYIKDPEGNLVEIQNWKTK